MMMKEPVIEFVPISDTNILTGSPGQGYDVCQRKGINGMNQEKFCVEMLIAGMDLSLVPDA